jgi:hypothetical protein
VSTKAGEGQNQNPSCRQRVHGNRINLLGRPAQTKPRVLTIAVRLGHGGVAFSDSLCFERGACRDYPFLEIAPKCDHEFAGDRNDGDAANAASQIAGPMPKPASQRALRLIAQPQLGELNAGRSCPGMARFADALVSFHVTASETTGSSSAASITCSTGCRLIRVH